MAGAPQKLAPQSERITDLKISKDRRTFESMQERIRALNATGVPFSNYHLAKAQAYLDVALDEYLENDRSSFVELALGEANGLLQNLEAGAKGLPLSTYPLDTDKNLRPGPGLASSGKPSVRTCGLWPNASSRMNISRARLSTPPNSRFSYCRPFTKIAAEAGGVRVLILQLPKAFQFVHRGRSRIALRPRSWRRFP
jgi:hypothetical protein